jgi:hypothetical protein
MTSVTHSVIEFTYSSKVFGNRIVRIIFVSKGEDKRRMENVMSGLGHDRRSEKITS